MKVMIIDLGSDVREEISKVASVLQRKDIEVIRPVHSKELAKKIVIGGKGVKLEPPDLVVHFDLGIPNAVAPIIESFELAGIKVINPFLVSSRLYHRVGLSKFLDDQGISQPLWYYGYPGDIPPELGEEVVQKSLTGHLVQLVQRDRIHSSDEVGFFQKLVENPSGITNTVYWVFGHCFTAAKSCVFACPPDKRQPKKMLPDTDKKQLDIVRRIQEATSLYFFGVEFVNGQVVDVNPYPNPFCHHEAVSWFAEGICSICK